MSTVLFLTTLLLAGLLSGYAIGVITIIRHLRKSDSDE